MYERNVEQHILVAFSGPGAGTAPLTWGQKAILQDMRETGWTHNASGAHALPAGTTIDDVADQLRRLMSDNPALRVRMGFDEHGEVCQVAAESGEIRLDVIDIADEDDPAPFTDDMWFRWLLEPFDHHHDWSMRMAIIRHKGVCLYRVWTLNHLVVDGGAIGLLMADLGLSDMLRVGDPKTVGLLELGHREQTPRVRKLSDRAMAYWEAQLRPLPSLTFGEPTHPEGRQGSRYWHGRYESEAAYLAMLAIAHRTRTDTSRVLLAVIATAIARVTNVSPLTAKVIVNNRFRPGFAEAIAPLSQNSMLTIDIGDGTVDEVVARARRVSLTAGMNAYYDPSQLDELIGRLDQDRGYPAQVSCRINDRRVMTRNATENAARDGGVTMEEIQKAISKTWLSWDGPLDNLHEQAFITVEDYPGRIHLQVIFDMACFTEDEVEAMLHGVEKVAIEAAFDSTARTGVTPTPVLAI